MTVSLGGLRNSFDVSMQVEFELWQNTEGKTAVKIVQENCTKNGDENCSKNHSENWSEIVAKFVKQLV